MMYKIALVCENGASTGIVVKKMQAAAQQLGIEAQIKAYPYGQMPELVQNVDYILIGPQLAFKKEEAKKNFPHYADRINVIQAVDFGMMRGEKILKEAVAAIDKL